MNAAELRLVALDIAHRLADPALPPLERQLREELLASLRVDLARAQLLEGRHGRLFAVTPIPGLLLAGPAPSPSALRTRAKGAYALALAVANAGRRVRVHGCTRRSLWQSVDRVVEDIAQFDLALANMLAVVGGRREGPGAHLSQVGDSASITWFPPPGVTIATQLAVGMSGPPLMLTSC